MRRNIVAGNWKMHKTADEADSLVRSLLPLISNVQNVDVVLCPPYTALIAVSHELQGSGFLLGAQNMHEKEEGAFTGEISAAMLLSLGVSHVILGHSERRHYFIESDPQIREKVASALRAGLRPILCVGESLSERESGNMESVIAGQLEGCLEGIEISGADDLVVAYEPVWAIGTGQTATPEQAQEVHAFIRAKLTQSFGVDLAGMIRIQYGGSVKPDNAVKLMEQPDIDGALVGGASLDAESFAAIVRSA